MFENVSLSLKYDSIFFVHKHMYTDHFTMLSLRVHGYKCVAICINDASQSINCTIIITD